MNEAPTVEPTWWRLQGDLAWGRTLLFVASLPKGGLVRAEVYLFLGDRYWRLARQHFVAGRHKRAERLVRKARAYFRQGGGPEPPPLAVASMPIPVAPSLTAAVSPTGGQHRGSDDAA